MNVTEFFKDHVIDVSKLTAYGFRQSEEGYEYAEALSLSPMAVRMHYDGKRFTAEVIDRDLKETYLPFEDKDAIGEFIGNIRQEVWSILEDIKDKCTVLLDTFETFIAMVKEKFTYEVRYPWTDMDNGSYYVFSRPDDAHWFALFMKIRPKSLKLQGDALIQVMNIKLDPQRILALVDDKHYFPAYHMNKAHWMTVLFDKETDVSQVLGLLQESYDAVYGKPKKLRHKPND